MLYTIGLTILVSLLACGKKSAKINEFDEYQRRELENAFQQADKMIKSFFGEALKVPIDVDVKTIEYLRSEYRVPGKLSQVVRYPDESKKQVSYVYRIATNDDEVLKTIGSSYGFWHPITF